MKQLIKELILFCAIVSISYMIHCYKKFYKYDVKTYILENLDSAIVLDNDIYIKTSSLYYYKYITIKKRGNIISYTYWGNESSILWYVLKNHTNNVEKSNGKFYVKIESVLN